MAVTSVTELPLASRTAPASGRGARFLFCLTLALLASACTPQAPASSGSGSGAGASAAAGSAPEATPGSGSGAQAQAAPGSGSGAGLDQAAPVPPVDATPPCDLLQGLVRGIVDAPAGVNSSEAVVQLQERLRTVTEEERAAVLAEIERAGTAAAPLADQLEQSLGSADHATLSGVLRALAAVDTARFAQLARTQLTDAPDPTRRWIAASELARSGAVGLQILVEVASSGNPAAVEPALQALANAWEHPEAALALFNAGAPCAELTSAGCRDLSRYLARLYPDLLAPALSSEAPPIQATAALLQAEIAAQTRADGLAAWAEAAAVEELPTLVLAESLPRMAPDGQGQLLVPAALRVVGDLRIDPAGRMNAARVLANHAQTDRQLRTELRGLLAEEPDDGIFALLAFAAVTSGTESVVTGAVRERLVAFALTGQRDRMRQAALTAIAAGADRAALTEAWALDPEFNNAVAMLDTPSAAAVIDMANAAPASSFSTLDTLQLWLATHPDEEESLWANASVDGTHPWWLTLATRRGASAASAAARLVPSDTSISLPSALWLAANGQRSAVEALVTRGLESGDAVPEFVALQTAARLSIPVPTADLERILKRGRHPRTMEPPDLRSTAAFMWNSQGGADPATAAAVYGAAREAGIGTAAAALLAVPALLQCPRE